MVFIIISITFYVIKVLQLHLVSERLAYKFISFLASVFYDASSFIAQLQ